MSAILFAKPPLSDVVDILLADVAVRIQLSPSNYTLAIDRYNTVNQWIERDGSPLQDQVQIFYAQGSMAIGTTIASKLENDEFDIDVIAQLNLPCATPPSLALDVLEKAIRGEKGSRYYNMTTRCTRCVQIQYADNMHLDVTPMVRLNELPDRCGLIFHAKENGPHPDDISIIANPYGFAEWFKIKTPPELDFAAAFAKREVFYNHAIAVSKADAEPVPEQAPAQRKSKAVIALQLLKRWRNIRYDKREGRRPASIVLAKLVADAANQTATLSEELLFQAQQMLTLFVGADQQRQLIEIRNPACSDDVFTDRWPASLYEQRVFLNDLRVLVTKLERLVSSCDLATMREILTGLFGERPALEAITAFNKSAGSAIAAGKSFHNTAGGCFDLAASGVTTTVSTSVVAASSTRATPKHTHFGGDLTHDIDARTNPAHAHALSSIQDHS